MANTASSLTVSDAAACLACSGQTIRKLIRSGKLPAFRIGRDFRIIESDLEKLRVSATCEGGAYAK